MSTSNNFSHIHGRLPSMVDVSDKAATKRYAKALAELLVPQSLLDELENGDLITKKGPVFQTAIIAGTMAVKNTSALIPFCHSLTISAINFDIKPDKSGSIRISCEVTSMGLTGVEMEALTGATVAALAIYDMCKSVTTDLVIRQCKLVKKTGGKHDFEE
jgi:cyclic pyranopterin phosphate synthase